MILKNLANSKIYLRSSSLPKLLPDLPNFYLSKSQRTYVVQIGIEQIAERTSKNE